MIPVRMIHGQIIDSRVVLLLYYLYHIQVIRRFAFADSSANSSLGLGLGLGPGLGLGRVKVRFREG